jgi:hypothetical protein
MAVFLVATPTVFFALQKLFDLGDRIFAKLKKQ